MELPRESTFFTKDQMGGEERTVFQKRWGGGRLYQTALLRHTGTTA